MPRRDGDGAHRQRGGVAAAHLVAEEAEQAVEILHVRGHRREAVHVEAAAEARARGAAVSARACPRHGAHV